jgi:release factor glutamine methyltransferase
MAVAVGGVDLHAADVEPAAVACARRNLAPLPVKVYQGDLFDPLPDELRGLVDTLVANVPYVPSDAVGMMPPEARDHEPRVALDGGSDGLDLLRRVASGAARWLVPGGHVLMEIGEDQVPDAMDALASAGLVPLVEHDEELGATVVIGRRPAG